MTYSDLVVVSIALFAVALPFILIFFIIAHVRERRRRNVLANQLAQTTEAAGKAVEIGKRLQNDKNTLTEKLKQYEQRFAPIIELDREAEVVSQNIVRGRNEINELRASYFSKKEIYDRLLREVAIFDEKLAFAEMGVYEPHFEFTDSEEYKRNIDAIRGAQKGMVTAKTAVLCTTNWTVDGVMSHGVV